MTKLKSSDTSEQDRQAMQWGCEMEHVWTLYHAIFLNDLQQILAYFASWHITELVLAELMWSSEKDQLLFFGFIVASRQCFLVLSYLKLTWVKKREVWPAIATKGTETNCCFPVVQHERMVLQDLAHVASGRYFHVMSHPQPEPFNHRVLRARSSILQTLQWSNLPQDLKDMISWCFLMFQVMQKVAARKLWKLLESLAKWKNRNNESLYHAAAWGKCRESSLCSSFPSFPSVPCVLEGQKFTVKQFRKAALQHLIMLDGHQAAVDVAFCLGGAESERPGSSVF